MDDRLRILVVDDEPGMTSGVMRALRDYSVRLRDVNGEVRFDLDSAGSGEEAMEKIAQAAPDILLLDYKLPGVSGLDLLEKIAQRSEDILTVMITAYASLETAVTATKRGAYDFLAKPFTPEELKSTIRKAAGRIILMRQARKLSAEKRQIRFQFTSVLAHEMKAPLAAVEGYLRIIKDHAAGDDAGAYEHMIERSLIRLEGMRKLISDLLDLTRIESGQRAREIVECDVAEVARAAMEPGHVAAEPRGIRLALHADGLVVMRADRTELEIILNNLISNAVKYNRDGGAVDVTVASDGQRVTISVVDTGIGMSAAEAEKLFKDFVRIKNPKTRNILGSGLGLSTVKKLALMYGGDATVASTPDAGSTFTVTLLRNAPNEADGQAQA